MDSKSVDVDDDVHDQEIFFEMKMANAYCFCVFSLMMAMTMMKAMEIQEVHDHNE